MFRTIVVGTDTSATAALAVDHARRLAVAAGAKLVVVSAHRPPDHVLLAGLDDAESFFDEAGPPDHADPRVAAEAAVAHVVRAARADGIEAEGVVRPGAAARVLADVAAWKDADLIVVGDRGMRHGHRQLGSVPHHLSHHAPCSLLIVATTNVAAPGGPSR